MALFAFGRTIHCTCGTRVGLAERVRSARRERPGRPTASRLGTAREGEPRFCADAMLGRLARWLRILGYDTTFWPDAPDELIVRHALDEDRVLLTRDRALPEEWRIQNVVVLRAESTSEQLRELARVVPLDPDRPLFQRCPRCNGVARPADPESVRGRVPARILADHGDFTRCSDCGRVYWQGSHTRRIRETLAPLLQEWAGR